MAAKPPADTAAEKPKSKKMLFIIVGVLLLALAGGGAFFFLKKSGGEEEGGAAPAPHAKAPPPVQHKKTSAPPQFLPLENLVVNLADEGGNRFIQVGITLQVSDEKIAESVKSYMPAIRNSLLMLVSSRLATDLLQSEGKAKLQEDVLDAVREETGMPVFRGYSPVEAVLFSSFIIQ